MDSGLQDVPASHLAGPLAAVMRSVHEDGLSLSLALSRILKREKGLGPSGRRGLAHRAREAMTHRRRVDFALRKVSRIPDAFRYEVKLTTLDLLMGRLSVGDAWGLFPKVPWGRVAAWAEQLDRIQDPVERLAIRHSLPDWAAKTLIDSYGEEEARKVGAALEQPAPRCLRANRIKIDRDGLMAALVDEGFDPKPSSLAPDALILPPYCEIFDSKALDQGLFEIQDEASQLGAEAVAPPPKGSIIEGCAGSGGKTLALAGILRGKGTILALDISAVKLSALRRRVRRAGASQVRAVRVRQTQWSPEIDEIAKKADRIVMDVPCSGLGAFRRQPELRWRVTPQDLETLEDIQLKLTQRALSFLKPGARLIYSTCSLRPEENERQIERLMSEDSSLELVRLAEVWGKERAGALSDPSGTFLTLRPDIHGCDGFFGAILRRR